MAKKAKGGWWLGATAAGVAVGALLIFTAHKASPPSAEHHVPARVQQTVPEHQVLRRVSLGSYGAVVHPHGQSLALQIRPLAELRGPASGHPPPLNEARNQEILGNLFLRFDRLPQLVDSQADQTVLANAMRASLNNELSAQRSAWRVESLQLHPTLGPIPAGN